MLQMEPISEKKRHSNLFSFLCNGKQQILSTMVCYPSANSNIKEQEEVKRGIFGTPLKLAIKYSAHVDPGLSIPVPIYRCFEEIFKRGLKTEGIFRLSGAAHEIKQLQQQLDRHPTFGKSLDLSDHDIHAIAGVAKLYLRQLPDPVIPTANHQSIIDAFGDAHDDSKLEIAKIASIIKQLPREHFHLIYYIIQLATRIQQYSKINMMNAEALSVVLSPVLTGLEQNLKDMPPAVWNKKSAGAKLGQMGQLVLTNSKWTNIWTMLISEGDALLKIWNRTLKRESLLRSDILIDYSNSSSDISSESTQPLLKSNKKRLSEVSKTTLHNDEAHVDTFKVVNLKNRSSIRRCSSEYKMDPSSWTAEQLLSAAT